jgi:hypothetical protein
MGFYGRLGLLPGLLLWYQAVAFPAVAGEGAPAPPTLALLDPINLHNRTPDPELGELMRKAFAASGEWRVIPRDTVVSRFREYRMDVSAACHEFQCSFDAGNVLAADYVLFGSVTPWGDLYAYTLNITHVRTSQVVWTRVGEVLRRQLGQPAAALEATMIQIAEGLEPEDLDTRRGLRRGLLSVLDLSPGGSTPSRIMAERVASHLYASRNFDIMSRREMEELLAALEMRKSNLAPTDSGMFALGGRMGISHLVYSRLTGTGSSGKGGQEYSLQLALYDISAGKKVRDWPSQPGNDFRKILEFENKFFSSLFKLPEYDSRRDLPDQGNPVLGYGGAAIGAVAAAVFGFLAWSARQDADSEYERFKEARSRETALAARERVEENDRKALVYGGLGGLGLAGAGAFLLIAF